jgi:predicted ATPase/DNA-binding CsgD family transcriptional regulator/Tfp pilus assembly protein PilF
VAHNLPAAVSSFVGREQELGMVAKLLGGGRLVTLTGAAGVGKTRLAVEVAAAVAAGYADGAWLVELAPVVEPAVVASVVAATLGVRERPGRSLVDTMIDHLRHRQVLVVLDNCEHLVDVVAALAEALLHRCPDLRVVVTSRQPLGIGGEVVWPVPPLSLPPVQAPVEDLGGYEAVRLFAERAAGVEPGFGLDRGIAVVVADICRRLDGLPLAIELAAGRVGVFTPAEIAARLDDRFRLLTVGSRTALRRHQTLLAAVEWSYELLCQAERGLLRRLSVFAGGCSFEAVEWVCADTGLQPEQIVELLAGLVTKSLVVADTSGTQARYRMLETIRLYGADRLVEAGEDGAVQACHAAYYTGLAERAEPELVGAQQAVWFERLEVEHDNLRVALEHSLTCGPVEQGLRLALVLSRLWSVRGYVSEGRAWLDRALAAAPDASPLLRAKALGATSGLAGLAGDGAAAVAAAEQSLAIARRLADPQTSARALSLLGGYAVFHDPARARAVLEQSVTLATEAEDHWGLVWSLWWLGWVQAAQGDHGAARGRFQDSLAVAEGIHDPSGRYKALAGLGYVALQQGDYGVAEDLLEQAVAGSRELSDLVWTAGSLGCLGDLAAARGDYARARSLLDEGLVLARQSGYGHVIARVLQSLGKVAQAEGDLAAARPVFEEGLALLQAVGNRIEAAELFVRLGEVAHALDEPRSARELFDRALAEARHTGARPACAQALTGLARLACAAGDAELAASVHQQALRIEEEMGDRVGVIRSLEALAGLAAHAGRAEHAARLFSAAESLRAAAGCARPPTEQAGYDADLALARQGLSDETISAAWEQGQRLSLREAVSYASKGRGPRQRPATGWASLTRAERDVAQLAAQGLTNPEIGQQLFVSRRTVQTHLAHIFKKLDITSRKQLTHHSNRHNTNS